MKIEYIKEIDDVKVVAAIQTAETYTRELGGERYTKNLSIEKNSLLDNSYNKAGEYFILKTTMINTDKGVGKVHQFEFSKDEMIDLKNKIEEMIMYQPEEESF